MIIDIDIKIEYTYKIIYWTNKSIEAWETLNIPLTIETYNVIIYNKEAAFYVALINTLLCWGNIIESIIQRNGRNNIAIIGLLILSLIFYLHVIPLVWAWYMPITWTTIIFCQQQNYFCYMYSEDNWYEILLNIL